MRFFFRSRKFKILATVMAILLAVSGLMILIGETAAPATNLLETIISPFQIAANWVGEQIHGMKSSASEQKRLAAENDELRKENESLISELLDYQNAMRENEFLKEFLEIKEGHTDFIMEPASVVSRDLSDPYGGFTLNKGTLDGIAINDPVITSAGLVGYISGVGLSYAEVTSLYSSSIHVAASDRRTADVGVVSGTLELAANRQCRMSQIQRTAGVAEGDYIVTAGGNIFPEGLLLGRIASVKSDATSASLIAELNPIVDIPSVQNVMVITYFSGQGTTNEAGK